MNIKNLKLPQYISTKNKTITVCGGINNDTTFIDGKGYLAEDGSIWIFSAKEPISKTTYPFFWFDGGNIVYSTPSETSKKEYRIENLKDLDLVTIIERTKPGEVLLDEVSLDHINSGAAFYVPTMKQSDDFLKKLVKSVIITKQIDVNALKAQTEQKYVLSNMRAALENKTKMSVKYFLYWMELLECDFQVIITDNDNSSVHKLNKDVSYTSNTDGVMINDGNKQTPVVFE